MWLMKLEISCGNCPWFLLLASLRCCEAYKTRLGTPFDHSFDRNIGFLSTKTLGQVLQAQQHDNDDSNHNNNDNNNNNNNNNQRKKRNKKKTNKKKYNKHIHNHNHKLTPLHDSFNGSHVGSASQQNWKHWNSATNTAAAAEIWVVKVRFVYVLYRWFPVL